VVLAGLRADARHPPDRRNPFGHGKFDLASRRKLAREFKTEGYTRAFVLPHSWKSALVPYLARIPKRIGYRGEARYGLLTDVRRLDKKGMPRLVDRFAALAASPGALVPLSPAPALVPDPIRRAKAMRALNLKPERPVIILCPGAEFGAAKRWPPNQFADLAGLFLRDGLQEWIVGSPNDKISSEAVLMALGDNAPRVRDLTGRTDLGTTIDILSSASLVVTTTPASCTPRPPAFRWSRCSGLRRRCTRRRCRRSRASPG
jgi:heptosyltransferase-2